MMLGFLEIDNAHFTLQKHTVLEIGA